MGNIEHPERLTVEFCPTCCHVEGTSADLCVNEHHACAEAGVEYVRADLHQGAVEAFERVGKLAAGLDRDRSESDKVIAYAQELARLAERHGGEQ